MVSIMDFRSSVVIIGCFGLIYTGCSPPIQTLEIYNNGQSKLVREYKVVSSSLGTDSITVKLIKYYRNGIKHYQQDIMKNQPNGKYYSWHPTGVMFAKGKYLNGKLSDKWTWWGKDGLPDSIRTFRKEMLYGEYIDYFGNGKPHKLMEYVENKKYGYYKELDEKGKKVSVGEYRNDIPHGHWIWWKNRIKTRELTYENGLKNGPFRIYDKLGKKKIIGQYKNDKKDGEWNWFSDQKGLDSLIVYNNNQYNGEYNIWHANGNPAVTGYFYNGLKNDEWKWFNKKGQKDSIKIYDTGQLFGLGTIYYDGRQPREIMTYLNNKLHGKMTSFYRDGTTESEITFANGLRSGSYKYWDSEGNIEEKGTYLKDKLHGLVSRWYTIEQLSSTAMFSSGKLQGLMRIFSPSGSTMKEGYYFEGLPVVIFEYYENGRFRRILAYRGNEIIQEKVWTAIGVEITTPVLGIRTKSNVHSNGNPSYECTYKNNIKHGIEWNWGEYFDLQSLNIYDQGSLVLERTWTAPGVPKEDIMFPGRSKQVIIGSYSSAD